MTAYRNVAAVMVAMALLQTAAGALGVALPLAMHAANWSALAIGLVISAYAGGFLAGAYFAPHVISMLGHIRAYAAAAGLAAALTLLLALDSTVWWWALTRFAFGACAAGLFAVAESWIADATEPARRGAVVSVYQMLGRAGLIAGPFLITLPGIDLTDSFIIAGVFVCLALVPVTATRRAQPVIEHGERVSPLRLLEIAPAAAIAAFTAGLVNTAMLAFLPIWAKGLADVRAAAPAAFVLAAVFGLSMLVQWPVGRLSDRVDRRWMIAGLAAGAGFVSLVLVLIVNPGLNAGAALVGLWGGFSLSYYAVAVAHAADRSRAEELPAIASGMLMVWALGAIIGPVLAGAAFNSPLGERGLFLFAAVFCVALAAVMTWRARVRGPAPEAEREPFVNLQATSAQLAEIHPASHADETVEPAPAGQRGV
ncbi:MAG: MFS transporter [Pseudomonadota bacterium]